VAGRAQALDLLPFQGVKGVAGDVGFAVVSGEGIAEVDNTWARPLCGVWMLRPRGGMI
jgi:hypothetical protein